MSPLAEGDFDETASRLLDTGVPALSIAGAALQGAIAPPWVELPPAEERVAEASQTLNRDVTLARRLSGDQGSWFSFTPEQAAGSRGLGSWFPKGVNPEAILESAARESDEPAPPDPPKYAKVYQWATVEGNLPNATPEARADIDLWKRGQDLYNFGRVTLARQIGLENKDGSPSVGRVDANRRIKYALRSGVLDMIRPGYLRDDWRAYFKKVYDSKNTDAIEEWERGVNAALSFKDKYGRSLEGQLEELMEAPADDIPGAL